MRAYFLPDLVENEDGTVTDKVANLMWMQSVDPQSLEWEEALQFCEDIIFAG